MLPQVLVPIFSCVVLPVMIVWIVFRAAMNADNKRAEVLIKAIESNNGMDADKLAKSFEKRRKTPRELLNLRLLRGCIFTAVGVIFIVVGLVSWASGTEFGANPVTIPMLFGGAAFAIGISYLIVYFVTRKEVAVDTEK